ncbi:hypothetical protein P153DRAFT_346475 [Dothidotthia symphoricarpi CBS 119687]|uniref:C2H2-type domain-containing protein n=1 Tax=Dothidotthia symphoricarpi CBS 119687 TaxID=1392245 RepID=A0A6A6A5Z1_9PLEO|nr:uncharacterized protein P153DRAFT_346475 [Dothidotthia symphoricarpi CBS 119687]KAF2126573.1 hypothetical protein P153DRAFT_346475 [Dothidotthia symphoricarpi CBS 119687]
MSSTKLLNEAIDNASVNRLRDILKTLCSKSDVTHASVCNELLLAKTEETNSTSARGKRKRDGPEYSGPRFATCGRCFSEFDVTENGPESCQWHDGKTHSSASVEFWADTEEETFGPTNTDANKEEFPEGFIWSCCEVRGDEGDEGCQQGPHRVGPNLDKSKKLRFG